MKSLLAPSLICAALLAAAPLAASAQAVQGLNYSYVEGGYIATDTDGGDADGGFVNASVAVSPNWHVFAGYNQQKTDDFDIELRNARFGVGYNTPVGLNTDLLARIAYERFDTDLSGVDALDGYSAEVGARSEFTSNFEGYALAGYEDGDQYDGDFYGRLGAQVKFNDNWGITGDVKFADSDTQWMVGPRYSW